MGMFGGGCGSIQQTVSCTSQPWLSFITSYLQFAGMGSFESGGQTTSGCGSIQQIISRMSQPLLSLDISYLQLAGGGSFESGGHTSPDSGSPPVVEQLGNWHVRGLRLRIVPSGQANTSVGQFFGAQSCGHVPR